MHSSLLYIDGCISSFSFISGVSGTSLFNSVSLMAYNVFYTSVPVLVSVLDKDLSEETVMQHPQILFYCQAGRFVIVLLFVIDSRTIKMYNWVTLILVKGNFFMAISLGKHLTINIETGFWILVHLLDGLGDLSSMWVLFDINQLFINYWDDEFIGSS